MFCTRVLEYNTIARSHQNAILYKRLEVFELGSIDLHSIVKDASVSGNCALNI